ncbi:MAG: hypothetical protein Q9184_001797 [Pyrenodesmia sp. 2 TL-2023]
MASSSVLSVPKPFKMEYSPEIYNKAKDLETSILECQRSQACQWLEAIRDVFLLHGMESRYVAGLIHRHFDMASNERLTDIGGNISEPVTINDDGTTDKGSLLLTDWVYDGARLRPLEFSLAGQEAAWDRTSAFAQDLYIVLKTNLALKT